MSNVVQGVPTPAEWPESAGNFQTRVTRTPEGYWKMPQTLTAGHNAQFVYVLNPGVELPTPFDWDAMLSAHEMIDEHDQRIRDIGQIPDLDPARRRALWTEYYRVSQNQFAADAVNFQQGKPPQQIYASDGVPTFSPDRIAARVFAKALKEESDREDQVVEELIATYGPGRTVIDVSRTLALDPVHQRILNAEIDRLYPPAPTVAPDLSTLPKTATVTNVAPPPALGAINVAIMADPSLPPSASNILTSEQNLERIARQASAIVSDAPEYYRAPTAEEAAQSAQLRDYFYWKANAPFVALVPSQNPGLRPLELTNPWTGPGLAPLVLVQITPQQRPLPEKDWLASHSWVGLLASAIPFVGGIIAAGLNYETNSELKKWAGAWKPNPDEFAPQFYPKPFQVPMPLDRAQIMVREPWYAPAMVDEFAAEVRENNLIFASQAYARLVAAMNQSNPPAQLTSASAPPVQGTAIQGDTTPKLSAGTGGAFPFIIGAVLLAAGAPIAVPVVVVVLLAQKK